MTTDEKANPQLDQATPPIKNEAIHRARVRDVVQKTTKPNIGCLGIVRVTDDIGVTCINRSAKANEGGADIFTLRHGEYVVIGRAAIHLPKDPPDSPSAMFGTKPTIDRDPAAGPTPSAAVETIPVDGPTEATAPPAPVPIANQTRQQTPSAPVPTLIPKVTQAQRDAIGGIQATNPSPPKPAQRSAPPPPEPPVEPKSKPNS